MNSITFYSKQEKFTWNKADLFSQSNTQSWVEFVINNFDMMYAALCIKDRRYYEIIMCYPLSLQLKIDFIVLVLYYIAWTE